MSRKISIKLFAITAVFFLFLIVSFLIFQAFVFEGYYEAKKANDFEAGFKQLYSRYLEKGLPGNAGKSPNYLEEFKYRNNADAAIVDVSDESIRIAMLTGENENEIFMNSIGKDRLRINASFTMPQQEIPAGSGGAGGTLKNSAKQAFVMSLPEISIGGIPGANNFALAVQEFLALPEVQSYQNMPKPADPIIFTSDLTADGVRNIIAAVLLKGNEGSSTYLFAVSSLQPVGEAVSVIKDLYVYFAVFAVILILLLALVFSNMVSKPLVRLNATAMKMARLDFSARCEEKKKDEIGSLAHNLNFLSGNLQRALNDLKIANNQLTEDIEKERQLEKMRKEFVAGVSHELKTPISLIMGYAEGLKENLVEGADKERYINVISDETQKMGNLVNDMLDLSQLESGRFKLKMEEFCMNELVEYTMRKFKTLFAEKQLKAELRMPEENLLVYADEFRIEQVINNFLNNAIRHTPEHGAIRISIAATGTAVRIEIENEGNSIDEADLLNIWQKFYKAEKSRNREAGGTGLGLAIVSSILQHHNAGYGVENTEAGVRFFFELPGTHRDGFPVSPCVHDPVDL